jgi:hypothetical protein
LAQAYIETGERDKGLAHLLKLEQALDALEAEIDSGWMFYSYGLENDPSFDAFKEDQRFLGIVQKRADRMAEERQWYEDHKSDPLF